MKIYLWQEQSAHKGNWVREQFMKGGRLSADETSDRCWKLCARMNAQDIKERPRLLDGFADQLYRLAEKIRPDFKIRNDEWDPFPAGIYEYFNGTEEQILDHAMRLADLYGVELELSRPK